MNNEIIDKNLKLIYESPRDYTDYFDFIDIKINPQKRILAEEMDSKGLIKLRGEFCYKTDFGKEVMDKGGWIKHKELILKKENRRKYAKAFMFFFNIIIPLGSMIAAYLALNYNTDDIKNSVLEDMKKQYMQYQLEQEQRVENLTKKMDSVLLKIQKTD